MSKSDTYRYYTTIMDSDPVGTMIPTGVTKPVVVDRVRSYHNGVITATVTGPLVSVLAWVIDIEGWEPSDIAASILDDLIFIESAEEG
jgi:hypothetical protein